MKDMYPELIDYIFQYYGKYYSAVEIEAIEHNFGVVKLDKFQEGIHPRIDEAKKRFSTENPDALKLLENGYAAFIKNTAIRIFNEHGSELVLNLCQKCGKIARTPKAKQCRFCGNSWH